MARWALPEYSVMKQKGVELNMRAVITVIGKDMVGILARVSSDCARHHINVLEVTQSILQDMFAMIMMVDISGSDRGKFFAAQVNVFISTRVCT